MFSSDTELLMINSCRYICRCCIFCYVHYVFLPVHEDAPCMSVAMKCSCVWATLSTRLTAVYLLSVVVKISLWGRLSLRLYNSVAVPPQETAQWSSCQTLKLTPPVLNRRVATLSSVSHSSDYKVLQITNQPPRGADSLKCFQSLFLFVSVVIVSFFFFFHVN